MANIKISLCQLNPWVGNLSYNLDKIKAYYKEACVQRSELIIFPECALTGYPLEDLVLKPHFMEKVTDCVEELLSLTEEHDVAMVIGTPWLLGKDLFNAALFICGGKIQAVIPKQALPNYGVFDEKRIFKQGAPSQPIVLKGISLGIMICEDMWVKEPSAYMKEQGSDYLLVLNGSPYDLDKQKSRLDQARQRVAETGLPLIYVNLTGGQDSLVFDGNSFILDANQKITKKLPSLTEGLYSFELTKEKKIVSLVQESSCPEENMDQLGLLYSVLVTSLRDYIQKNGFEGVLLGLSGGIDSALSAAIAVDALGADRVACVMMPSPYTSQESLEDAHAIAQLLNVSYDIIPIDPAMQAFDSMLKVKFQGTQKDITEENIQSRSRGLLLMALSNKLGWMVLSTGNKSEMAVGYATLYGDMCGGFNTLKDVYKMQVFELSHWRNTHFHPSFKGPKGRVMSERVITKPPSAELKPDQKDQDSLPPYEDLDRILSFLIEEDASVEEIVKKGFKQETVERVYKLLDRAEYKRRQACPGPKITSKALAFERRYPITNGYILNVLKQNS